MRECINCCMEFEDDEIVEGTDLCIPCFQEEEEIRNNPIKRRLDYELKRNFRLNDLLQESVKILEKDISNNDLVKRIKEEIIMC